MSLVNTELKLSSVLEDEIVINVNRLESGLCFITFEVDNVDYTYLTLSSYSEYIKIEKVVLLERKQNIVEISEPALLQHYHTDNANFRINSVDIPLWSLKCETLNTEHNENIYFDEILVSIPILIEWYKIDLPETVECLQNLSMNNYFYNISQGKSNTAYSNNDNFCMSMMKTEIDLKYRNRK